MKTYLKRLYNAILGREFREPWYLWDLDIYILDLVVDFIDSNRYWYPVKYTEKDWENKLQRLKNAILEYNKLDEDSINMKKNKTKHIANLQKNEKIIKKELWEVLFNLWD